MSHKNQVKTDVLTEQDLKMPSMYSVILHNDDYTTMDFVVQVLTKIFHRNTMDATNIMMEIHNNGKGVAGIYTYDIAVTKKVQADQMSNAHGFPLKITLDLITNEENRR